MNFTSIKAGFVEAECHYCFRIILNKIRLIFSKIISDLNLIALILNLLTGNLIILKSYDIYIELCNYV